MPDNFNKDTFLEVYRDDYLDSDHYHRILFNSARPVQARELTQLQTIMSKEVERFGHNIFKEGAAVNPVSNVFVDNTYRYVQVTQTTIPDKELVGLILTGETSSVQAKILEVVPYVDASNPLTVYVEYTNTDSPLIPSGTEPITFSLAENIINAVEGVTFTTGNTADAVGVGTKVSVNGGVFFVRGHFVQADPQSIILSRYTSNPTDNIGFKVLEDIITVDDDTALYDNQGVVPNLSSPGADRYRIRLELIAESDVLAAEQFVYVTQVNEGLVVDINNGRRDYNRIYDTMAERTYEESGDYAVRPFLSVFEEHPTDASKLVLNVQPGLAYVKGYRSEPGGQRIDVNKPVTTVTSTDDPVSASYGNYVLVSEPHGLFSVDEYENINLRDDSAGGGNVIGSARTRSIEDAGDGKYRLYLFDVQLDATKAFRDVISMQSGTVYANVNPNGPYAELLDVGNNDLFFSLPNQRPDWTTATSFDMTVQRTFTETSNGSGEVVVDTGGVGTFTQTSEWLVFDNTDTLVNVPLVNFSATGGSSVTISGLNATEQYRVYTLVDVTNIPPRTKSIATGTVATGSLDSDQSLSLARADIISITSIIDDTSSADVTNNFRLDNGQRDNFYDLGKITLNPGAAVPATTVTVTFKYYSHSTSGGYFYASSYAGIPGFTYSDIPTYRTSSGQTIDLREAVDFRPTIDYNGTTFTNTVQGGRVNPLPRNTDTISSNISYYYPRRDLLVVNVEEELKYIEGVPSFEPELPDTPPNAMALYEIYLGANTIDTSDLRLDYIDNRRYTMRDIGKLEKRIEENRELITLNLLELETSTLEVLDENGLARTKAGFFVDNFTNHKPSDVANSGYLASLDIERGIMRPHFHQRELPYLYDSASSTSMIQVGNSVMLSYTHETFITQPKASGVINVNPFNVITNNGIMSLVPSKDNWRDQTQISTSINPANFISTGNNRVDNRIIEGLAAIDPNWGMWDWSWFGRDPRRGGSVTLTRDNFTSFLDAQNVEYQPAQITQVLQSGNTGSTIIGITDTGQDVVRSTTVIDVPFMRSREIAIKISGLMPVTRHYPFFDDVDVLTWCESITEGEYDTLVASMHSDNPPIYSTEGMTELAGYSAGGLTSNSDGTLYIRFLLPNNDTFRFSVGTREFAVYDITVPIATTATSQAASEYAATGVEERIEETGGGATISATFVTGFVPVRRRDPLAQTFFNGRDHGVFMTRAGVYFATKDDARPVICEIRPVVNGYPSATERMRYGIAVKTSSEVVTSSDATVETVFEFDRPVYLEPNTEYSLVIRSESDSYYVWQATMGEFEVGSSTKRISSQPSMGSLFISQNGATWEPEQTKDLKFNSYVAVFEASGQLVMNNTSTRLERLPADPFITTSGSSNLRVLHPYHGMVDGDLVRIERWSTADSANDGLTDYVPAQLETDSAGVVMFDADHTGYSVTLPSSATVGERAGSSSWVASHNVKYQTLRNAVNTFQPDGVDMIPYNRLTSIPSLMESPAAGYTKDVQRSITLLQKDIVLNTNHVIGSGINETAQISDKSLDLEIDITSDNTYLTPIFHLDDASFIGIENVVDWQDSAAASNRLVPYNFVEETDPANGSYLSKYIAKEVSLASTSTGLKILVAANKPAATEFDVYYKTANESQVIEDQTWVLVSPETPIPPDDNPNTYREYRYLAGGPTGTLDEFSKFKVKIVMKSYNEAKVPTFKDLRVIAMSD